MRILNLLVVGSLGLCIPSIALSETESERFHFKVQSDDEIASLEKEIQNEVDKEGGTPAALTSSDTKTALLRAHVNCPQGGLFEPGRYRSNYSTWTRPNTSIEVISWEYGHNTCRRGTENSYAVAELRSEEGFKFGYSLSVACRGKRNFGGSGCMGEEIKIFYKE